MPNAKRAVSLLMSVIYYFGRCGQILGMWLLVVDIFTAGPLGPNPRLFALGVGVFLVGWGLTKIRTKTDQGPGAKI